MSGWAPAILPEDDPTFVVEGGVRPRGVYFVQGSKNTALPAIAAALLPRRGASVLRNVPPLNDIRVALTLAERLGARVSYDPHRQVAVIDPAGLHRSQIPDDLAGRLRASILFMAPLLVRTGAVSLGDVGGCALGTRAVDYHYRGFVRMGAVQDEGLGLHVTGRLVGATMYLDVPSHTGTENLMMGAALAKGASIIENAGCDPEIVAFSDMLRRMGARISGAGSRTLTIEGVDELQPVEFTIPPDRLDAGYAMMLAGLHPDSDVTIVGLDPTSLRLPIEKLRQMGVGFEWNGHLVRVRGPRRLRPINVVTHPHPGFATDLQPLIMALASVADGTSYIREHVFTGRFAHSDDLAALGATIEIRENNRLAVVHGVERLRSASVAARNIRAGIALLTAATFAEGTTRITEGYQIERGHVHVERRLGELGLRVRRQPSEGRRQSGRPGAAGELG